MVRIVHTGDMHFDSPFAQLPSEVALMRREEQRETFMRIIMAVKENKADMLLIAGDVFDSRFVSASTTVFLREAFAEIQDTPIFIAPGNHDFLSPESLYKTVDFGENVHIFGNCISACNIGECTVYGYGFPERFIKKGVLDSSFKHKKGTVGILLMHGDVSSESDYNPVSTEILEQSSLNYVALGHVHTYSGIRNAGETLYAYSGVPESRHFDEVGRGGIIIGDISETGNDLSFVPTAKRENITVTVDITGMNTHESVYNKIAESLLEENLYKVTLTGKKDSRFFVDTEGLQASLSKLCAYIKIQDKTGIHFSEKAESVMEKRFVERLSQRDDKIAQRALAFGLSAFGRIR